MERAPRVERRLAAIFAADVEGYSRLMGLDEVRTIAALTERRAAASELIAHYRGRIVDTAGDSILAEFGSALDAVECAITVQRAIADDNREIDPVHRMCLRIGIDIGDVLVRGNELFGDGVNIAARLQAMADPGGVCISGAVYDQVRKKLSLNFTDLGLQTVKNVADPVRVYKLSDDAELSGDTELVFGETKAPFADKPSIAVLPFINISGDPEQEYFVDGITEDIITELAAWRAFPVLARNSTFAYKGRNVDIKKVAQDLRATYVLEGSVRKMGAQVRVTAQLIDAKSGHHLLAERFDRRLADIFAVQDEIVTSIVGAIRPELRKTERERAARLLRPLGAYDNYQRGLWHHHRRTKEDNQRAQEFFRHAIDAAPDYVHAIAGLSIAICSSGILDWADDPDRSFKAAYDLARRAVSLDSRDPIARFALGLASMWLGEHDLAVSAMREAIRLNPSHAQAHVVLGQLLTYEGHPEETITPVEIAFRLSPHDPRIFMWLTALAAAHYQMGRYQEAVDAGRKSWEMNRNWPSGLRYVVAALGQLGRMNEAKEALIDLMQFDGSVSSVRVRLQRLYQTKQGLNSILAGLSKAGMPD